VRPYLDKFVKNLEPFYEFIIFTASNRAYAETVIENLPCLSPYVKTILSRENCLESKNGFIVKDLRVIGNRDLHEVIVLDNIAYSFGFQIANGIPILSWTGNEDDEELLHWSEYLKVAAQTEDVRTFNQYHLKLESLIADQL
jgi:CTD small phosphatase-like protein 2